MIFLFLSYFAFAAEFDGVWTQPCQGNVQRAESFLDYTVSYSEKIYSARGCKNIAITYKSSGTYKLGEKLKSPEAAQAMDFVFSEVSVALHQSLLVEKFNREKVCGREDWSLNDEQVVTGQICDLWLIHQPVQVPNAGDARYGIFRLEQDQIFFGKLTQDRNGLTPDARPSSWDPISYKKSP